MIIGKSSGQNGWRLLNLHITTRFIQQQKPLYLKQTTIRIQEWDSKEKIKKIQEKARAVLEKAQKEMKRYADKKQEEAEEYKLGDLVLLNTKDLK